MTKFSTGKVHLIKRYFIALAKNFFQSPKFLQIYSKKSDWMTQARAPTGGRPDRRVADPNSAS